MLQDVQAVGLSYHKTPLEIRQLMTIPKEVVAEKLTDIKRYCNLREVAILSTCNRTEVYFLSGEASNIAKWLSKEANTDMSSYLYYLQYQTAVKHLFRVTSGLDSQIIGEHEIAGQVKQFTDEARQVGASGMVINRLLERSLAAAKDVRTYTQIGKHSVSYASLALRMAKSIFTHLNECSVLFIGTGDMTASGGVVFSREKPQRIAVVSRNFDKAEAMASRFNAEAIALSQLPNCLAEFDIVVSSTSSQVPILGKGAVEKALKQRRQKPIMFADLALPSDFEPEIKKLSNVFFYNLDQFAQMASYNNEQRELAAEYAEPIIARHVGNFFQWMNERENIPKIRQYRNQSDSIKSKALARYLACLARGDNPEEVLKQAINRVTGQMMHLPTQWLLADDITTDEEDESDNH